VAITIANRNAELNALLRATSFAGPATLYLSLHTADPGDTGASEYSTYTGTRPVITFDAAGSASSSSNVQIDFAAMGATTITYVGLWSAASAGTFQAGGPLSASKTTNSGDTLRFASAAVAMAIS